MATKAVSRKIFRIFIETLQNVLLKIFKVDVLQ